MNNIVSQYRQDLAELTYQDLRRLAADAALIFMPLATAFTAWLLYAPGLVQVLHP